MRLGQTHGARPDTGIHIWQVLLFQLFAGVGVDRQAGAGGQHRVQTERQVGRVDHFLDLGRDRLGHAHAAEYRITTDANPAAVGVGFIGSREAGWGFHCAVSPRTAFFIAATVQRSDNPASNLARLLENGCSSFFVHRLGNSG